MTRATHLFGATLVRTPIALLLAAGLALAAPALAQPGKTKPVQPTPAATQKIPVNTNDDLPRHTYQIDGKPSEFVLTDKPFREFVDKVEADTHADLDKYDIKDPTTLQSYHSILQQIDMLNGKWDDALGEIDTIRALEQKESKKLMTGQVLSALVAAKKASGNGADKPAFEKAFKEELSRRVGELPWDKVREEVQHAKGIAEIVSKNLVVGQLQGQLDPVAAQAGGKLSGDLAKALVSTRTAIDVILPLNPMIVDVYSRLIDTHKVAAKDIWSTRLVTLSAGDHGTPVNVAIWDSGVDVSLFKDQLWTNPKEKMDGKDDDGNGYVDDVHGIAFDLHSNPTPSLLLPLDDLRSDRALVTSYTKGLMDLQASVDSPEASALKKYVSSLKKDAVTPFLEDLGLFGNFAHGTHVAGIASAGDPFIRLVPVRISFDYKEIPQITPSVEQAEADARAAEASVAYMKAAGVRVCNMSWGGSRKDIEEALEKKGVGSTPQERAEISRKLFKIQRDSLEKAMQSAPEILFIAAAGNSDNDNQFAEFIPSGLNLPNLITVGAVDQSGKPTSFTTFGKNVSLYANGFEVESYIPGGQRLKFSGTSMAAPNTTNLAAKILALNPNLSTAQVVDLIKKGADPMEGYEGRFLIDPKRTIEMERQ